MLVDAYLAINHDHPYWEKIIDKGISNINKRNEILDKYIEFVDKSFIHQEMDLKEMNFIAEMFHCNKNVFDKIEQMVKAKSLNDKEEMFRYYYLFLSYLPIPNRYAYQMLLSNGKIDFFRNLYCKEANKVQLRKCGFFQKWFKENIKYLTLETIYILIKYEFIILRPNICESLQDKITSQDIKSSLWCEYYYRLKNNNYQYLIHNDSLDFTIYQLKIPKKPGVYILDHEVIGWKMLLIENESVIAKLKIPANTKIVRPITENKLRCSQYFIEWIKTKSNKFIQEAISPIKRIRYRVKETYNCEIIDLDINKVCTDGLHFFEDFDDALESEYNKTYDF